jgi:rubrerythrin
MERDKLHDKLASLAQMDRDAVGVYDEALEHVTDDTVRTQFRSFRGEHEHHVKALCDAVVRLGGQEPKLDVDTLGRLAEWVTSMRSRGGTEGALHAMRTAEHLHNRRYREATEWDVGDEALAADLRRFAQDEQGHLAYIEERLGHPAPTG